MKTLGVTQSWEETETAFMDALSISNLTKDKRQKLLQEFKSIRALEAESKKLKMNILGQDLKSCRADLTSLTSSVDVRYEESRGRFVEATRFFFIEPRGIRNDLDLVWKCFSIEKIRNLEKNFAWDYSRVFGEIPISGFHVQTGSRNYDVA